MKYNLEDVRKEYDRLDALCAVDTSDVELCILKPSAKTFGECELVCGKVVSISIAECVFSDEKAFWDTIRREYAYALVLLRHPNESHIYDTVFYAICKEIGCDCFWIDCYERDMELRRKREQAKYVMICEGCGHKWYYAKAGKFIKGLQSGNMTCRCSNCGSTNFRVIEK